MPTQTRQQVADEINRLESQGATESQIMSHIAKSGYKDTDFNVDMDGKTRPMVVGSGYTGNSSKADLAATQQIDAEVEKDSNYYESVVASSRAVPKTTTTQSSSSIETVTGGGTLTRYSTPAKDTPESTALDNAGTNQYKLGQAYAANPNSKTGQATLNRSLQEGVITQEEYDKLKNATPEERAANKEKAATLFSQSENSFSDAAQAKAPGSSSVEITPSENSSTISVKYENTVDSSSTTLSNSSSGKGTTEKIDGQTYDVEKSSDGTSTTYVPVGSPAGADAKIVVENTGNMNSNTTVDNGSDPYVSNGQSTVSQADNGADPYVSNGQSTISPEEDPFEKARQDSAAAYDAPGPTEADVIAANEPQPGGGDGTKTVTSEDNTPWVTDGGYQAIYALNKDIIKNPDLIYPGQVFKMPNGGTYTVAKGDTLTWIAQGRGKGKYSLMVSKQVPDDKPKDTGISVPKKQKLVKNDFKQKPDWRVRLSLAPHATYLYKAANSPTHLLYPLSLTDGVIFPYTPQIQVNYTANYDGTDLTHSNYKMYQYKNSEVGAIQITAVFTAQDVNEANYLLAVIHFFRSVTKMFYGQDDNPKAGTPPPLVYLSGYGAHQFDNHPLAITSFNMSLPDDVDYIRAGTYSTYSSTPGAQQEKTNATGFWDSVKARLTSSKLKKGGVKDEPTFTSLGNSEATYVPTKVQFTIGGVPIVTRNDISNNFSLEKYASGELLRGSKRQQGGGGIW